MKQSKSKKSAAASTAKVEVVQTLLPDAAYVAQLLAAAPAEPLPVTNEQSSEMSVAMESAVPEIESPDAVVAVADMGTLNLAAQCLLRDAVDCRAQLLPRLDSQSAVIDVAAVERIDTAYMQVLLTFVRSRPAALAAVTWLNVNAVFLEAVDVLGLRAALGLPADLTVSAA